MRVAIVDYDAGNVGSVQRACNEVGLDAFISPDPEEIVKADKVIFPGVGAAHSAVDTLHQRGLFQALQEFYQSGKPMLGICLGSQIVLGYSEEGKKDCLNLIEGVCERFEIADRSFKIPHIGWNEIDIVQAHPMLKQVKSGDEFYFVHSYFTRPAKKENIFATTEYAKDFCSVLANDNLFATQFHLEKSGRKGLSILSEFVTWEGGDAC
ncbi:MAG: glutamine amidotransferase [Flavobacterium sp.]|jgi:glutamine amidotransferase